MVSAIAPLSASSSAFATDPVPCTAPPNDQNGVHWPVGADAGTFTYQCIGDNAGFYTNAYYKYNPITTLRTALYSPDYSYNCATNTWSMTEWDYSPGLSKFVSSRVTPSVSPNLPTGCPPPVTSTAPSPDSTGGPSSSISNTGPGSTNGTSNTTTLNGITTNNTTLGLTNGVFSNATTGNTFVIGNTTGGSATSGNAQTVSNVANILQSSSNVFGPDTIQFVANINGDVNGDFMFDPSALLANTGPGSQNSATNQLTINTNNTNNTNAQINNTIDVGATSGNATVASNTSGGNATSGDATAVANLLNVINSTVASGHSFIGTVNINGNLNGDILLPQNLIDQLLASTGPGSTNTTTSNLTDNSTTTNNTTAGIANNITSAAQSGNASVANNTSAGDALSGLAGTNVTLLNLTGSNVVGKNDLLVFVNVQGHWVGMIVNAPAGSTSASLGGGITSSGPNSSNSTANSITDNSNTTNNANLGITNNLNIHANSGDASVLGNTYGGNATSGNAKTAVNILNIAGSNINLSNWFGILFINVFGNWTGSFGVNTSAGDPVTSGTTTISSNSPNPALASSVKQFASFVSHHVNTATPNSPNNSGSTGSQTNAVQSAVLGTSTSKKAATTLASATPDNATHASYLLPAIGISIAALMLLGERVATVRKSHKA